MIARSTGNRRCLIGVIWTLQPSLWILLANMFCYMVKMLSIYFGYIENRRDTLASFTSLQSLLSNFYYCLFTGRDVELSCRKEPIVEVICHPRLSGVFVVLYKNCTLDVFITSEKAHLLYTTSVKLDTYPHVTPLCCRFGSSSGSDQFSLYVVYSTGAIALQKIIHLPHYFLTREAMKSLNTRDPSLFSWFCTWRKIDEGFYEYAIPEGFEPKRDMTLIYTPSKPLSLTAAALSLYAAFSSLLL